MMNPNDASKYPAPPPAYSEQPPPPGPVPYPINPPYPVHPPYPTHPHPPEDGYPLPTQPTITTQQMHTITVITPQRPLGTKSEYMMCPHCSAQMWTRVETKPNMMTHTCALILCCFVLWPIAWLPYCCDACQSIRHYCSNCSTYIGEYGP